MAFDCSQAKLCYECNFVFATPNQCPRCHSVKFVWLMDVIQVKKFSLLSDVRWHRLLVTPTESKLIINNVL